MPTPLPWGDEFLVNTTTFNDQGQPTVTALSDGRFVVAWQDDSDQTGGDNSHYGIRGRVFNADGSPSGNDFLINSTTINYQNAPTITALSDGRFVVAWQDGSRTGGDTSGFGIRGRVFNADGAPAGNDFVVNSTTLNYQFAPTITALSDGRFVVAWEDSSLTGGDTSGYAIRGRVFNADGSPAGNDFVVNSTTINYQFDPTITALSDGRFVVAWTDHSQTGGDTSGYNAIRARVFNADGSPAGNDFVVNSTTLNYQDAPTITALSDGRFVVAWEDSSLTGGDTSGSAIRARVFNADGSPAGNDFVVNSTTLNYQLDPTITALSDGRFVVAWTDYSLTGGDTSGSAIRARVFNADGSPAGNDFVVNSTTLNYQYTPTITALSDGRFVVAWMDYSQTGGDTSGSAIHAQIFEADGTPAPTTPTAAEIFKAEGKLAFLSQLALSAYHLDAREFPGDLVNDVNPRAELAFNGSPTGPTQDGNRYTAVDKLLYLLTPGSLTGLVLSPPDGTSFPQNGLSNGIYTNENAAALVGRSADAVFLSFRGTNDAKTAEGGLWNTLVGNTPDKDHWVGKGAHYALFQDLIAALRTYVVRVNGDTDLTNNVTKLYVTGHSLGAGMVQAFMEDWTVNELATQWAGITAEAVTFASPGYGAGDGIYDGRIVNFWSQRDPILKATFLNSNDGHSNAIVHNLSDGFLSIGGNITDNDSIHYMALYNGFTRFFWRNGIDLDDLNSSGNAGQHFYSIHANVHVLDETGQLFLIGEDPDSGENALVGDRRENLMLGGGKDDVLRGNGGTDRLLGGTDWDKLFGGKGSDTLEGGFGYDELTGGGGKDYFVFNSYKETNSQGVGSQADLIKDFDSRFLYKDIIDLREIDANWNLKDNQEFDFIKDAAFGRIAGQLRFEQRNGETIIMGDTDGDGVANFFIRLTGLHTMSDGLFDL